MALSLSRGRRSVGASPSVYSGPGTLATRCRLAAQRPRQPEEMPKSWQAIALVGYDRAAEEDSFQGLAVNPLSPSPISRRTFLGGAVAATMGAAVVWGRGRSVVPERKAKIAITLDLEMSRHYPKRGMMEWDFEKGNLDADTKRYAVEAGKIVKDRGGVIHYFCVGRTL